MTTGLYVAQIIARETYNKPGITTNIGDRMVGYSKSGNIPTIHFLCISRPGLDFVVKTLEEDGKKYLKQYFTKPNGVDRTEYIDPKHKKITLKYLENFYRKQIENIPGILIVKKEWLPLTLDSEHLDNFMENCVKYPKKYIEGF